MNSILLEIITFLRNPYFQTDRILNRKAKFQYLLRLGFLTFLINIAFAIFVVIEKYILNKYGIEIKQAGIDFNKTYAILFIALFAPFYEELLFRLPLSLRKRDTNVSLFTLLGIVGYNLTLFCDGLSLNRTETSLVRFIFLFAGAGIVYLFNTLTEDSLEKTRASFGKYIVYGSIIIFALCHLSNVDNFDIQLLPLYLFNLLPILFLGIVFSFCRLHLGFFYGFLFHAAWNFLFGLVKI